MNGVSGRIKMIVIMVGRRSGSRRLLLFVLVMLIVEENIRVRLLKSMSGIGVRRRNWMI